MTSSDSPRPPRPDLAALPTLTEVVEPLPAGAAHGADGAQPAIADRAPGGAAVPVVDDAAHTPVADAIAAPDEDDLVRRALERLGPKLLQTADELLADGSLRAAVEPAMERLTRALVHELRDALAVALREPARQAVEDELARRRGG